MNGRRVSSREGGRSGKGGKGGGKEGGGHLAGRQAKGIDLSVLVQLCPFPLSRGCLAPTAPRPPFCPVLVRELDLIKDPRPTCPSLWLPGGLVQ